MIKPTIFNLDIDQEENQEGEKIANIEIYGVIGFDPFKKEERQNTRERVSEQINEIKSLDADKIVVKIGSLGGFVDDGVAIHNILASADAEVITVIMNDTASAGTIIHQAGDKRKIYSNSRYLIHKAWAAPVGNSIGLRKTADELDNMDENVLAPMYAKRSEKDAEAFLQLMRVNEGEGKWLSADEALDYGLVDEVLESSDQEVKIAANVAEDFEALGLPVPKNEATEEDTEDSVLNVSGDFRINGSDLVLTLQKDSKEETNQESESEAGETEDDSEQEKTIHNKNESSENAAAERFLEHLKIYKREV